MESGSEEMKIKLKLQICKCEKCNYKWGTCWKRKTDEKKIVEKRKLFVNF